MRLVTILALMALVVVVLSTPAIPKDAKKGDQNIFENAPAPRPRANSVTVIQGGKRFSGWSTDSGRIFVENTNGKIFMDGWMRRTGAVEIYTQDDTYVGQVNPMGNGLLMSPKTSDTIRIEVER